MSTLPPYSLETNYTANPFPARPNTKRVPPPLLLTNSNRPIPHALRPSSLYGAPAQVHSSSVEEMGQVQRHKSRSNVAQAQAPMTAQTPVTTLVYESPTFEARTHAQQASRGSSSSWASFPLASPVTQQELMLPELPDVVKQYAIDRAKVRKSTGGSVDKGTLTKEERLSRRSAVYGGTFGSVNTFGSGHMRSTSASASIGGTSVTRNETNEDDAPVRISVGSRPVSLRRVPVPTAQPVQQPIPVPVPQTPRVRVQSYEVISFPIPQVYDDNVGTNSNTVIPATNKPLPRSVSGASTSTRHHKPQNTSSDGSDSSAEIPKYHMPSRLARDGSLNHGRGGSTDSGAESGSEYSGPGIAGIGSGKWV